MNTTPPIFPSPVQISKWPKVLGILSIVLGACGAIGGIGNVMVLAALGPISEAMAKFMPVAKDGASPANPMAAMEKFQGVMIANSVVALLVAVVLIVGGAQLLKRRAKCRTTILSWAALKTLIAVAGTVIGYMSLQDQMATYKANDVVTPGMPAGAAQVMGLVSVSFGFLWLIALPVFMVIWFGRRRIRDEVSSWL